MRERADGNLLPNRVKLLNRRLNLPPLTATVLKGFNLIPQPLEDHVTGIRIKLRHRDRKRPSGEVDRDEIEGPRQSGRNQRQRLFLWNKSVEIEPVKASQQIVEFFHRKK